MTTETKTKPATDPAKAKLKAKAAKWKGSYKDFLGELKGKERSDARKAWRSVHGGHCAEV